MQGRQIILGSGVRPLIRPMVSPVSCAVKGLMCVIQTRNSEEQRGRWGRA
jgi:hypothetical protein